MKLATKLWLSTALLIALILGIAGFAAWRSITMEAQRESTLNELSAKVSAADNWSRLSDIAAARTYGLIVSTNAALQEVFKKDNLKTTAHIDVVQKQIEAMRLTNADHEQMDVVAGYRKRVIELRDKLLAMRTDDSMAAQAQQILKEQFVPLQIDYSNSIKAFAALQAKQLASAQTYFSSEEHATAMTAIVLIAVLALCVFAGAAALIRSIRLPLQQANQLAAKIAQGDLSADLKITRSDEFGELMTSILAMNQALVTIVQQIHVGTDHMSTASSEIASGNLDLSSRTEQQAASLQEAAASMSELTNAVKQNSENARHANQLAVSAADVAVRGGSMMTQVIDTMKSINDSAAKISEIIGVIDGIAFQTNILALNAAVEAARAGEHGRGFAVVASEVRTLAQRSASAAKDIKTLIGTSVEKVDLGTTLVNQAGTTVQEIVQSFQRVTDIIGKITVAGEGQAVEIQQINDAVSQMDDVTQQNAALVEQAAASAESLKQQATMLSQLVSIFKLHASASPAHIEPAMALPA